MQEVLDSTRLVVEQAKHVHIDIKRINDFAATLEASAFKQSEFSEETVLVDATEEDQIAFAFVCNALNFCFWGDPKWTVTVARKKYDGAFGLIYALKRALADGIPMTQADYLAGLTSEVLQKIFRGNVTVPLFNERLKMLKSFGKMVQQEFGGKFTTIVERADGDAVAITGLLVEMVPSVFADECEYHGHRVKFYKRAQLAANFLAYLHRLKLISARVDNCDQLTVFADYKIPQVMRKLGLLEYENDLARRVDNKIEIAAGSDEEIEIRASTVWAAEYLVRALKPRIPGVNAAKVDNLLWYRGQDKSPSDKPYHRTRTIWY